MDSQWPIQALALSNDMNGCENLERPKPLFCP